jgi:hypothetical protein
MIVLGSDILAASRTFTVPTTFTKVVLAGFSME